MSTRPMSAQELQSGMRWEKVRRDWFEAHGLWARAQEATRLGERMFYQLQERVNG